ncbi:hypothetical protein U1Q18_003581 [Sarracenia purpurea var. burkii]
MVSSALWILGEKIPNRCLVEQTVSALGFPPIGAKLKLPEVIFSQEETRNSGSKLIGENRRRKGEVGVLRYVLRGVGIDVSAAREVSRREKTVTAIGAVDLTGVAVVSIEGGIEVWQPNLGNFSGERRWIAVIFWRLSSLVLLLLHCSGDLGFASQATDTRRGSSDDQKL